MDCGERSRVDAGERFKELLYSTGLAFDGSHCMERVVCCFFSWALWQCIPTGFGCDGLDCVGDWVGKDSELDYTDSMVVWNDNDIEKNDKVSHFGI